MLDTQSVGSSTFLSTPVSSSLTFPFTAMCRRHGGITVVLTVSFTLACSWPSILLRPSVYWLRILSIVKASVCCTGRCCGVVLLTFAAPSTGILVLQYVKSFRSVLSISEFSGRYFHGRTLQEAPVSTCILTSLSAISLVAFILVLNGTSVTFFTSYILVAWLAVKATEKLFFRGSILI